MQVEHRPEAVFFAERKRRVDAPQTVRTHRAVRVLDDVIVDGDADMVKAQSGDLLKIRLGDEIVQALLRVIALGKPAAEVHALLKTELF